MFRAISVSFKNVLSAAAMVAGLSGGLQPFSAHAVEYYRAIEVQRMKLSATDGTDSESKSLSKRTVDLNKPATYIRVGKLEAETTFLDSSFEMSAMARSDGKVDVKATIACSFYGISGGKKTETYVLPKGEALTGDAFCSEDTLLEMRADVDFKIVNVQGSAKPVCPAKLSRGFVVSESTSSYHRDKLVFSSEATLTRSTSTECTYSGTLTQTWTTSQGSGSSTYSGSVTLPLSRF